MIWINGVAIFGVLDTAILKLIDIGQIGSLKKWELSDDLLIRLDDVADAFSGATSSNWFWQPVSHIDNSTVNMPKTCLKKRAVFIVIKFKLLSTANLQIMQYLAFIIWDIK